jgi:hypothetical protein
MMKSEWPSQEEPCQLELFEIAVCQLAAICPPRTPLYYTGAGVKSISAPSFHLWPFGRAMTFSLFLLGTRLSQLPTTSPISR